MIEIELNNVRYTGFTSVTVTRDIECVSGSFKIQATMIDGNKFPVQRGYPVKILIDGTKVLTGYIDEINISYTIDSHAITLFGRDKSADILDSKIDATLELATPISLVNVIQSVLKYLNISGMNVINQVSGLADFSSTEMVSGEIGQHAFEFLNSFCAKRQVLLTSNENGDLVITRGTGIQTNAALVNKINGLNNNIKTAIVKYDDSKRFNHYIIRSQPIVAALDEDDAEISLPSIDSVKGESFDTDIRSSRLLTINAEKACDVNESIDRAQWERDIRRARAINYSATVQGHHHLGNTGTLWQPLQIVRVLDDFCGVNDDLIIRKIEYINDLQGNISNIDLVPKDTFELLSASDGKKKKKDKSNYATPEQIKAVEIEYGVTSTK